MTDSHGANNDVNQELMQMLADFKKSTINVNYPLGTNTK